MGFNPGNYLWGFEAGSIKIWSVRWAILSSTQIYLQRNKQEKQDTMNSKEDYNENRDDFSDLYNQFRPGSGASFSQVTSLQFYVFLKMIFLDQQIHF